MAVPVMNNYWRKILKENKKNVFSEITYVMLLLIQGYALSGIIEWFDFFPLVSQYRFSIDDRLDNNLNNNPAMN